MSLEVLEAVKQQVGELTAAEKRHLAQFLLEQAGSPSPPAVADAEEKERKRRERADWLQANQEAYGGQYVALDGNRLVGQGKTYRVAFEAARRAGVISAYVDFVTSNDYVGSMGGW